MTLHFWWPTKVFIAHVFIPFKNVVIPFKKIEHNQQLQIKKNFNFSSLEQKAQFESTAIDI